MKANILAWMGSAGGGFSLVCTHWVAPITIGQMPMDKKPSAVPTKPNGPACSEAITASSSSFTALSPTRIFDTRQNIGGVGTSKIGDGAGNGTPLEFTITNKGGLPGSASTIGAVSLNVTVVSGEAPDAGGYVTVYPCGTRPDASNLNFVQGQTVPNAVIAPVSAQGKVCFYVYGKAHLIADVNGYFNQ